ncbi:hypothetical protein WN51_05661 [Melipona quadrifasciata]|uniref:Uncharacterized protein n=1 Tax=Melipona quadrifasciata TaxID=166423 RepID=A0A0M8ZSH5_9HYME|nr:hypothetical protein WN51_05661 [Melipona quadrifasciata]
MIGQYSSSHSKSRPRQWGNQSDYERNTFLKKRTLQERTNFRHMGLSGKFVPIFGRENSEQRRNTKRKIVTNVYQKFVQEIEIHVIFHDFQRWALEANEEIVDLIAVPGVWRPFNLHKKTYLLSGYFSGEVV